MMVVAAVAVFVVAALGLVWIGMKADSAWGRYNAGEEEQRAMCIEKIKAMKLPPTEIEAAMRVCESSCGKLP